jgi:hypothetical protein
MTDKELAERYKMALEAVYIAARGNAGDAVIMNIVSKALEAKNVKI